MAAKWLAEGEFDQVQPPLARRNYGDLKSLHAAYSANGYGRADTIPHRLMVTVLDHYLEDLKVARIAAEGKRQYRLAQELTNRFNEAKKQFREKQEWQVKDQQRQEVKQMEQAEKIMSTTFKSTWNNKHEDTLLENEERKKNIGTKAGTGKSRVGKNYKTTAAPSRVYEQRASRLRCVGGAHEKKRAIFRRHTTVQKNSKARPARAESSRREARRNDPKNEAKA